MTRQEYIEDNLLRLFHRWGNLALLLGIVIILGLAFLDFSVTPENFKIFLIYRVITATICSLVYMYNKNKVSLKRLNITVLTGTLSVSTMVALMIARYGGHASPYFGGIIITLIFIVSVSPPLKIGETLTGILYASIIYGLYLIPIIIYDNITDRAFFINANFFILASAASMITLRRFIIKRLKNEFGLQYDLEQQKKQLSLYSAELEKDVSQKEAALENSEARFKELFENANDGIAVTNRDGIIIDVNRRFSEITGFDRESLIGTSIRILEVNRDSNESNLRRMRILSGEPVIYETEHFKKDGQRVELEVSSKAININGKVYIQSFYRDITEKKRLQSQLFQAQKMESIGILAGSIAHDFDNIITSITGNIEMLKDYSNLDDIGRKRIDLIENSAKRARGLIAGLLSFTRKSHHEKRVVDLNRVIEETIELMKATLTKRQIDVRLQLHNPATIRGDVNQLSQVIMNLAVNAIDAMPSGGKITISTSLIRSEDHSLNLLLESGDYVLIKFSDNGKGISPEIKDRIFEPFFTTKKEGRGIGLGLSIVYRIIKEHGGAIMVESVPGETTFKIYLPFVQCYIKDDQTGQKVYNILIVEDEIEMLNFLRDLLESQGYNLLCLSDPLDAYNLDGETIDEIDLLITDIMMPRINGKELIRHLKTIKPEIRVIAISAHDIWNIGKKDRDIDAFVSKPFEGLYLISVVKRLIDKADESVNLLK